MSISSQQRRILHTRSSAPGFTLIELLVVISIISILAAILFPVFARARENARRASCQSNLKQLSLGILQYAQDNDSRLLVYKLGHTLEVIFPYVKSNQVFRCPSAPRSPLYDVVGSTPARTYGYGSTYGVPYVTDWTSTKRVAVAADLASNYSGVTATLAGPFLLDSFPSPVTTCMLAETRYNTSAYETYGYGMDAFVANSFPTTYNYLDRHLGGSNYAFMDGHVKWLKKETASEPMATNKAIQFWFSGS